MRDVICPCDREEPYQSRALDSLTDRIVWAVMYEGNCIHVKYLNYITDEISYIIPSGSCGFVS